MTQPNKWAPLRLQREWVGKQVRTVRSIKNNAGQTIPAGTVCKVDTASTSGFTIYGGSVSIRRVKRDAFELLNFGGIK